MKKKTSVITALDAPIPLGKRRYKNRRVVTTAQQALITSLVDLLGGARDAASKLGLNLQDPINWRNRASIPLTHQRLLVHKLNINPALLDYETAYFYNPEISPWAKLIHECPLLDSVSDYILGFPSP